MAAVSWKAAVSANWTTAADWSTGTVPVAADAVTIGFAGSYVVSLTTPITISSLNISDTGAVLAVQDPAKTESITGNFTNSGTVEIDVSNTGGTTFGVGGTFTNKGDLDIANTSITAPTKVSAGALTNSDVVVLNGAATLAVAGAFANTDLVEVDFGSSGGGSITVGGALTNSGTLDIGSSSLTKAVVVKAASLVNTGSINMNEGTTATATLDITGAAPTTLFGTYNLSGDALVEFSASGVSPSGGGGLVTGIGVGANVILNGPKALIALSSGLTTNSALTALASNAGTLTLDNGSALATTVGLDNSGSISVDSSGSGGSSLKVGGTLTNENSLQIGNTAITAGTAVTVTAVSNFGDLFLVSNAAGAAATLTVTGAFANGRNDVLEVDASGAGGSTLTIGGALTNNGTVFIGNASLTKATTVKAASLADTGSIDMNEGTVAMATLDVSGAAPTTLFGTYNLSGNALLEFGSGSTTAIGAAAQLTLNGPKALVALSTALTSNSALTGLARNAGTLTLENGAGLSTTVGLDNTAFVFVDSGGSGGSTLKIGGTLTNEDQLQIGNAGITAATKVSAAAISNFGDLFILSDAAGAAASLTVTGAFANGLNDFVEVDASGAGSSSLTIGGALTNNGTLFIGNGSLTKATMVKAASLASTGAIDMNEGTVATATLDITGAAPTTLFGTYNLSGDALIEFGSGGTTAIGAGAQVILNGTKALMALSSGLTTNSALAGLAGNAGTLTLENGAALAPTVGLDNSGAIFVDAGGSGGSSLKIGGTLTNEDELQIGNTGITAATTVSAATVSNFASLFLFSDAAAAAASLAVTGAFSNARNDVVEVDFGGAGGSSLTIGGALTNNGTLFIGDGSLTKATTVKAASLANSGTIDLTGGIGAGTATLNVTGASSDTNVINVSARGILALGNTLTIADALNLSGGEVSGGTLAIAGAGVMQASASFTSTLNAVTIAAGSLFTAAAGSTLIDGGVTVSGSLSGSGGATLDFSKATAAGSLTNVSGFPTIGLANVANTLTVTAANFAGTSGVITIIDGNSGNTVSGSALPAADHIVFHAATGSDALTGGAGGDIFFAGGKTTMTGGAGTNEFAFSAAGSNTIADFAASATNEILFSNGGFALGQSGASSTPKALPASLFIANATGAFTAATQRFAYDTANGNLFYSASGTTATEHAVATLTNHPALAASHLFFIS